MSFDAGSIHSTLELDRSPFIRSLSEARREAANFARQHYEATLDAAKDRVEAATRSARATGQRFAASRYEAKLDGDPSGVRHAAMEARQIIRTVLNPTKTIDIKAKVIAETRRAEQRLEALKAVAESVDNDAVRIEAEANVARAEARLAQLYATAKAVGATDVEIKADADTRPAITALRLFQQAGQSARHTVNNFNRSMHTIRNVGALAFRAGILSIIGAIGPLTAAVGVATSSLGGLAAGYGLILAAAIPTIRALANHKTASKALATAEEAEREAKARLADAQRGLNRARASGNPRAIAEGERAVAEASKELALAQDAVKQASKEAGAQLTSSQQAILSAWGDFTAVYNRSFGRAQTGVDRLMARTLRFATGALPTLGRAATASVGGLSSAFDNLFAKMSGGSQVRIFNEFLSRLPRMIDSGTTAIGNLALGLFNLLTTMQPDAQRLLSYFERLTNQFLRWTQSASGRNQVRQWLSDVLPVAGDLVKGVAKIAAGLFRLSNDPRTLAFFDDLARFMGYVGDQIPKLSPIFGLLSRVTSIIEGLPKPIKDAAFQIGAFYLAFNMLGGAFLVGIVRGLITFVAGVGRIIGVGGKASGVLAKLGGGFTRLGGWIYTVAMPAVARFGAAAGKLAARLLPLAARMLPWLGRGLLLLAGPVGVAVAAILTLATVALTVRRHWSGITAFFGRIFNSLPGPVRRALTIVGNAFRLWGNIVRGIITGNWRPAILSAQRYVEGLPSGVQRALRRVVDAFRAGSRMVRAVFRGDWRGAIAAGLDVIGALFPGTRRWIDRVENAFDAGGKVIRALFRGGWRNAISTGLDVISALFPGSRRWIDRAEGAFAAGGKMVLAIFRRDWRGAISAGIGVISALAPGTRRQVDLSEAAVRAGGYVLRGIFGGIWRGAVATGVAVFNALPDGVRSRLSSALSSVSSFISSVRSYFGSINLYTSGQNVIVGFINGLWSRAGDLWNAARRIIGEFLKAIRNRLRQRSPSREMMDIGDYAGQGLVKGLLARQNAVRDAARKLADAAREGAATTLDGPPLRPGARLSGLSRGARGPVNSYTYQGGSISMPITLSAGANADLAEMERIAHLKVREAFERLRQGASSDVRLRGGVV